MHAAAAPRFLEIEIDERALVPRLRLGVAPVAAVARNALAFEGKTMAEHTAALDGRYDARYAAKTSARFAELQGAGAAAQLGNLAIAGTLAAGDAQVGALKAASLDIGGAAAIAGAVTAQRFSGALDASQLLSGTVPSDRFAGSYFKAVTLDHAANQFTGSFSGTAVFSSLRITLDEAQGTCDPGAKGRLAFTSGDSVLALCDGTKWVATNLRAPRLQAVPTLVDLDVLRASSGTFTLTNTGDVDAPSLTVAATAGYRVQSSCGSTLAAQSTCIVTILAPLSTTAPGRVTGIVTVSATGAANVVVATAATILGPTSCKAIKDATPGAASGGFLVDTDGPGPNQPIRVYCDMETDGGGWTLAAYCGSAPSVGGYNLPDLRCGEGAYRADRIRDNCAALPSVELARASTHMGMSYSGSDTQAGTIMSYTAAWKIAIPDPSKVNFVNHSQRGPFKGTSAGERGACVKANVATLKGTVPDGDRYFFANALGVSWSDAYPTGYGVSENATCNSSWDKGPFFASAHSGSGNHGNGRLYSNACVNGGRSDYHHRNWYDGTGNSRTGSVAIWFK